MDVQGMAGKKKDFTSLPYAKVQAFSVETAGGVDRDSEMELWFSGIGRVKFEFKGRTDAAYLSRLVATYVL
ncbi:MAG: PH domain-containing protein [Candidatus Nanopelagicales bacterium]